MISALNLDDIKRVAKKYLKPDQSTLVVIGEEKDFDKPLDSFGEVGKADLTIY